VCGFFSWIFSLIKNYSLEDSDKDSIYFEDEVDSVEDDSDFGEQMANPFFN
jgi:hypothetical protein